MNEDADLFYRAQILQGLEKLPAANQRIFKLMYGRGKDLGRSKFQYTAEEAETRLTSEVVVEMPSDKLDWALTQVQNSLAKVPS